MVGCAAKGSEGAERKEVPISGFQVGTLSWLPKGTDVIAVSFQTKERQRNSVGKTLSHHCWLDRQKGKKKRMEKLKMLSQKKEIFFFSHFN